MACGDESIGQLDRFNELVRQAHERSLAEHRAYLIVWNDAFIALQPAAFLKTEPPDPIDTMPIARHDKWRLEFPAALSKKVPAEWIFWESGVCDRPESVLPAMMGPGRQSIRR